MRRLTLVSLLGLIALGLLTAVAVSRTGGDSPPLPTENAKNALARVEHALAYEQKAFDAIGRDNNEAKQLLHASIGALLQAEPQFFTSKGGPGYSTPGVDPAQDLIDAWGKDATASVDLSNGEQANALEALRQAILLKEKAISYLDGYGRRPTTTTATTTATTTTTPPKKPSKTCTSHKVTPVYGIPRGFNGTYNKIFPHGIPRKAKIDKVSFIDEATGKPPGPMLFPGQRWSVDVKGFQKNGEFVVQINVSGKGAGTPNALVKSWETIVTYNC